MRQWDTVDFINWINNGCDTESAVEANYLSISCVSDIQKLHLLKHFINLRYLNISSCNLSAIPEEVWELTQLTSLDVSCNDICEISPKIKNLTNLEQFYCNHNSLISFPIEMCQLTKLFDFCYDYNHLDVLDPDVVNFIRSKFQCEFRDQLPWQGQCVKSLGTILQIQQNQPDMMMMCFSPYTNCVKKN